ncbi:MAG: nitroreductase family protein [Pseudomonadota bacterium]
MFSNVYFRKGLDTCPQAAWIPFQAAIRKHLEIPDDEDIVSGMSLGYADPDAIENTLISDREDLDDVVHWKGF